MLGRGFVSGDALHRLPTRLTSITTDLTRLPRRPALGRERAATPVPVARGVDSQRRALAASSWHVHTRQGPVDLRMTPRLE